MFVTNALMTQTDIVHGMSRLLSLINLVDDQKQKIRYVTLDLFTNDHPRHGLDVVNLDVIMRNVIALLSSANLCGGPGGVDKIS